MAAGLTEITTRYARRSRHIQRVEGVRTVYAAGVARTNIDLDERLLALIMRRYGVHTKREAVDLALRWLAGQPMTIEEALDMRGAHAIAEVPPDSGP